MGRPLIWGGTGLGKCCIPETGLRKLDERNNAHISNSPATSEGLLRIFKAEPEKNISKFTPKSRMRNSMKRETVWTDVVVN